MSECITREVLAISPGIGVAMARVFALRLIEIMGDRSTSTAIKLRMVLRYDRYSSALGTLLLTRAMSTGGTDE